MLKNIKSSGKAPSCPDRTAKPQGNTVLVEVLHMYFDLQDIYLFARSRRQSH